MDGEVVSSVLLEMNKKEEGGRMSVPPPLPFYYVVRHHDLQKASVRRKGLLGLTSSEG